MTRLFLETALLVCLAVFVISASAAVLVVLFVKLGRRSWPPKFLDTATVEEQRSHPRTDASEPSPGPAATPDADPARGRDDGRRPGDSADAGGGPHT